jgi:hypothetical protein
MGPSQLQMLGFAIRRWSISDNAVSMVAAGAVRERLLVLSNHASRREERGAMPEAISLSGWLDSSLNL